MPHARESTTHFRVTEASEKKADSAGEIEDPYAPAGSITTPTTCCSHALPLVFTGN